MTNQNLNLAGMRFRNNSAATGGAIALQAVMTAQIKRSRCAAHSTPQPWLQPQPAPAWPNLPRRVPPPPPRFPHPDSFTGHSTSANGGVLTTTGTGASAVKLTDVTVEDSTSGGIGGCFEVVSSNLDCVRCTVTDVKVRAEPAPCATILYLHHHHSHHIGAGEWWRSGLWRRFLRQRPEQDDHCRFKHD